jgi:hypothetical protein
MADDPEKVRMGWHEMVREPLPDGTHQWVAARTTEASAEHLRTRLGHRFSLPEPPATLMDSLKGVQAAIVTCTMGMAERIVASKLRRNPEPTWACLSASDMARHAIADFEDPDFHRFRQGYSHAAMFFLILEPRPTRRNAAAHIYETVACRHQQSLHWMLFLSRPLSVYLAEGDQYESLGYLSSLVGVQYRMVSEENTANRAISVPDPPPLAGPSATSFDPSPEPRKAKGGFRKGKNRRAND